LLYTLYNSTMTFANAKARSANDLQTRFVAIRKALRDKLVAAGHKVDLQKSLIDGRFVSIDFVVDRQRFVGRGLSGGHGDRTGGGRVVAGNYRHRKQFPIRKDGTVDLDKLVAHLLVDVEREKAKEEHSNDVLDAEKRTREFIDLRSTYVPSLYSHVERDTQYHRGEYMDVTVPGKDEPVQITATENGLGLTVAPGLTIEQLRDLFKVFREMGLVR